MTELAMVPIGLKTDDEQPVSWFESALVEGGPWKRSAVGTVFDIDCAGAGALALELVGTFSGQSIVVEQTIDGEYWFPAQGTPSGGAPSATAGQSGPNTSSGISGNATLQIYPIYGLRVRVRIAAIASGTISFFAALLAQRVNPWTATSGVTGDGTSLGGYPVRVGARGVSAMPAALTNNQTADLITTLDRRLVTQPLAIPEVTWSYPAAAGGVTNNTAVTIKAAGAAGIRNYLRSLQIRNTSAVESEVAVRDGAGGTVLWRGDLPANMTAADNIVFDPPLRGSAATLMEVVVLTTGTKTYINAQGYQGA